MRAFLKNYRQAPRKVRLVANAVRGKSVAVALAELSVMPQKVAPVVRKLIASALANAAQENTSVKADDLYIRTITVDKGLTYTRYMPRAFGRATPIHRECAHVRVELAPVTEQKQVTETPKPTEVMKEEEKNEATK